MIKSAQALIGMWPSQQGYTMTRQSYFPARQEADESTAPCVINGCECATQDIQSARTCTNVINTYILWLRLQAKDLPFDALSAYVRR